MVIIIIIIITQRLTRHIVSVIRMTNRRCVLDVENEKCVIPHDHGRPHIGTNGVRVHHFVVKFSKFSSPQAARGTDPPNQNPANVPAHGECRRVLVCLH